MVVVGCDCVELFSELFLFSLSLFPFPFAAVYSHGSGSLRFGIDIPYSQSRPIL